MTSEAGAWRYRPPIHRLNVGLLGCGVVGGGVVAALHQSTRRIEQTAGLHFDIVRVAVRDLQRDRGPLVQRGWLCTDWRAICEADDVDIVVEAMGGLSPAKEAIEAALAHGKHVITANKQLLAAYGEPLRAQARRAQRNLLFEASVLGGIPALHAFQTYFGANQVQALRGIVNGTSNFILTRMRDADATFAEALAEAQAAGYAEADPTADVEGYDALYKLQILARAGLSIDLPAEAVYRMGIAEVTRADLALAERLGCKVKHVAEVSVDGAGDVCARVGPAFVAQSDALYSVDGVQNALVVRADLVGELTFAGPGAGAMPTASAIVEDLVKVRGALSEVGVNRAIEVKAPVPDAVVVQFPNTQHTADNGYLTDLVAACFGESSQPLHLPPSRVGERQAHAWLIRNGLPAATCQRLLRQSGLMDASCTPVYGDVRLPVAAFDVAFSDTVLTGFSSI